MKRVLFYSTACLLRLGQAVTSNQIELTNYDNRYFTGKILFGIYQEPVLISLDTEILVVDSTNCVVDCFDSFTTPSEDDLFEVQIGQSLNYTVASTSGEVCLEA